MAERQVNVEFLNVSSSFEGHSRSEYIFVTDLNLYDQTKGKELELRGDSAEFIEAAGCNRCHLKDTKCIPIDSSSRRGRIAHYFVWYFDKRKTPCSQR